MWEMAEMRRVPAHLLTESTHKHDSVPFPSDPILHSLGHERASYVISGIPFSTLPRREREHILRQTLAVLETDGKLAVYQFSSRVLPDLERIFGYVERGFAPLNVLPAHLFFATAGTEGDRIR